MSSGAASGGIVLAAFVAGVAAIGCPRSRGEEKTSRFVVELAPGQVRSGAEEVARAVLGAGARVRPLFEFPGTRLEEADAYGLDSIYVMEGPRQGKANLWDTAEALRARGGFSRVEPDLEHTLAPAAERAHEATGCFWDPGVAAPEDRGWALRRLKVGEAWTVPLPEGGRRFGRGVRICHPDTGWTDHPELAGALDLDSALDLLDTDGDAHDPLEQGSTLNPGHGTATGSVIASRGGVAASGVPGTTGPGEITGVAPAAKLVEIRAMRRVFHAFDSDVSRAVAYSAAAGCDVVSMSLGGRLFFGLERAVHYAVDRGLIVVAAAGNCVGFVVAPAVYPEAIAVAATNAEDRPWRGSSHGEAIAIAAPGEDVWCARALGEKPTEPSDGTSFATAEVAGAAALWLAHHGRAAMAAARGTGRTQDLFAAMLADSVTTPPGWDRHSYGPGILDVEALLSHPIPALAPRSPPRRASELELLARQTGQSPEEMRVALGAMFGFDELDARLEDLAAELSALALEHPDEFRRVLQPGDATAPRAARSQWLRAKGSARLREALR